MAVVVVAVVFRANCVPFISSIFNMTRLASEIFPVYFIICGGVYLAESFEDDIPFQNLLEEYLLKNYY